MSEHGDPEHAHGAHLPPEVEALLENPVSRRNAVCAGLGAVALAYGAAMAYPLYQYLSTPARKFAALAAVKEVTVPPEAVPKKGEAVILAFGIAKVILIHQADDKYTCFSAVCTHLGCTVQFQAADQRIYCHCHGGVYDMHTGKNVAGPPPKPLAPYNVELRDGQIVITRA